MAQRRAIILDGYVDEPTALGVPPYISPYPRYTAGVLQLHDIPWNYMTIDQWREDPALQQSIPSLGTDDILVVVAGLTVPGHYKGGSPLTLKELEGILHQTQATALVGGPIRLGYTLTGGTEAKILDQLDAFLALSDLDATLNHFLKTGSLEHLEHTFEEVDRWAPAGASVVKHHPRFPHVIVEIETARGCERDVHCTFCTEGMLHGIHFREATGILDEIEALAKEGTTAFRIGKQPNLFAWPGKRNTAGVTIPDPKAIHDLFSGIADIVPNLNTLHIDNVNPGFIAANPGPSLEIAETIARFNTPGDVAAFGVESVDPVVVAQNNLKCDENQALQAVEVINQAGAHRDGPSLPKLLPGINLLFGLPGESARTYEANWNFLNRVADKGLLLRRINIRQVMAFPGTPLYQILEGKSPRINKVRFKRFKQRVQEQIEGPMLQSVAPVGTILRRVILEYRLQGVTFGRQLASYPLLVGFPMDLPLGTVCDAVVVDHGFRSITALPFPVPINELGRRALASIPGIGIPRAQRILQHGPYQSLPQFLAALDDPTILEPIQHWFQFPQT